MLEIEIIFDGSDEDQDIPILYGDEPLRVKDFTRYDPTKQPPRCTVQPGALPPQYRLRYIGIADLGAIYRVE